MPGKNTLERQHHPRQLATGCNFAQRPERFPRVRRNQEFGIVDALLTGTDFLAFPLQPMGVLHHGQFHLQGGSPHLQVFKLDLDLTREFFSHPMPHSTQL
ncbi:hypothetical protein D3C81_1630590 [compost metagenome]